MIAATAPSQIGIIHEYSRGAAVWRRSACNVMMFARLPFLSGARSPSGKAKVCKTFIGSSILPRASNAFLMNRLLKLNFRLVFLILLLMGLAARELALEQQPSYLKQGLHMIAYVGNTADGTVTAIDLIKLTSAATVSVGAGPTGIRPHPTRNEIWGLSTAGGYAWVMDALTNQVIAKIPVGGEPYALDFSPDGTRAYVAASASHTVVEIDCATRRVIAKAQTGRHPWIARVSPSGKLLVVSNRDDATLSILDAASMSVLGVVKVVPEPEQIAIL